MPALILPASTEQNCTEPQSLVCLCCAPLLAASSSGSTTNLPTAAQPTPVAPSDRPTKTGLPPAAPLDRERISQQFYDRLQREILILDGAMGTMTQRLGLTEADVRSERFADHDSEVQLKNFGDVLGLTRPEAIVEIHRLYLEAARTSLKPIPLMPVRLAWRNTACRTP